MPISIINFNQNEFKISYKIYNLSKKTNIIILHGWGSNKDIMEKIFAKQDNFTQYKMIFIDLPGFGKSDNNHILNTSDYANIINLFLKKINIKKDVIIGHSFGGKIATILNPKLLVLLSSAGIIVKKEFIVLIKIYTFKILKIFGFGFLRHFFISKDAINMPQNMYETFKNVVDENFEDTFKNRQDNTLIFWGKEDIQTPISSGEKIHSLIKNSNFIALNGDHFFFANTKNSTLISEKTTLHINAVE